MPSSCKITLFENPISLELDDLDGSNLDVFFAYGIVNPFGPTLTFVATASGNKDELNLPVVNVMLNPFQQTITQVGTFTVGDEWIPTETLKPLINLDNGDCPTLILITNKATEDSRHALVKQMFQSFGEQALTVYQSIYKYYGDPWTRVSQAMAGAEYDTEDLDLEVVAKELAELVLKPEHIEVELAALGAAWEGSIEKTGISEDMKNNAMPEKAFKDFLFTRLIQSLWLPDFPQKEIEKPKPKTIERLKVESLDHLISILESEAWKAFDEDQLADLFRCLNYVYGQNGETIYIKWLCALYKQMIAIGIDADTRLILEEEFVSYVDQGKSLPVVFLPFLIEDNAHYVVSKAVIDFVSMSDYYNGELYAFTELRTLFQQNTLANRGVAFGALVAIGDKQSINFAKEFIPLLTLEEVRSASKVHTQFLHHLTIQFWIEWTKALVESRTYEDESKFGCCASALTLALQYNQFGEVVHGNRNYPCQANEEPIIKIDQWPIEEYAKKIANDLYELEALEAAPKLFSSVLRSWGLMPHAKLMDQYIPNDNETHLASRKLQELGTNTENPNHENFIDRYLK